MKPCRIRQATGCPHRHTLAGVAVAMAVASCAQSWNAPPVGAPLVSASQAPRSELQRGYEIHQANCARCHPFEDPANHDVTDLKEDIMPMMARKANLDRADKEAVLAYLLAARKVQPTR